MATCVRSYSKVNLGLAIGEPRADGFHGLLTLYQTLALHDFVTVSAARTDGPGSLRIRANDPRVPTDGRNTVWKIAEAALTAAGISADVTIEIEKRLPIQGGMGAGSANAAAALLGLERELGLTLPEEVRMRVAAGVGSDVPLFLVGGTVLGTDRGQVVEPAREVRLQGADEIACVVALPRLGVSTPAAFREWDKRRQPGSLQQNPIRDTIKELSRAYEPLYEGLKSGASGIVPASDSAASSFTPLQNNPENLQGLPREQLHGRPLRTQEDRREREDDLAENSLLALVRTGIENDFESVVFAQYPSLREIKRHLMGVSGQPGSAVYAALSGSGSALFGLYRSAGDAAAAQQRLQQHGIEAIVTRTIARSRYWGEMFAE